MEVFQECLQCFPFVLLNLCFGLNCNWHHNVFMGQFLVLLHWFGPSSVNFSYFEQWGSNPCQLTVNFLIVRALEHCSNESTLLLTHIPTRFVAIGWPNFC